MRFLAPVDEDAVVTAWLRAELGSERFRPQLLKLLGDTHPGEIFVRDAAVRRQLLARHRRPSLSQS